MANPPDTSARGAARTYVGIHDDEYGGMTFLGGIVKDGWIFGVIPETESCAGWTYAALEALSSKVRDAWGRYGYRVDALPPDIREHHTRIHAAAIERARALGWDPELSDEEE
jgi:hypothetical protein